MIGKEWTWFGWGRCNYLNGGGRDGSSAEKTEIAFRAFCGKRRGGRGEENWAEKTHKQEAAILGYFLKWSLKKWTISISLMGENFFKKHFCGISSFHVRFPQFFLAVRVQDWGCFSGIVLTFRSVGQTRTGREFQSQRRRRRLPRRENTAHLATNFTFTPRQKKREHGGEKKTKEILVWCPQSHRCWITMTIGHFLQTIMGTFAL